MKRIKRDYKKDITSVSEFVEELPLNLKNSLSMHIYEQVYKRIDFL